MAKPEVYGKWKRPEKVKTVVGKKIVDTTGYVSPNKLIASYIKAGKTLEHWREMQYQVPPVEITDANHVEVEKAYRKLEDQVIIDPTQGKGYDRTDAETELRDTKARIEGNQTSDKVPTPEKGSDKYEVSDVVPEDTGRKESNEPVQSGGN